MLFKITTVKYRYRQNDKADYESLGFEFVLGDIDEHRRDRYTIMGDIEKEISTPEELVAISNTFDRIIIEGDKITIYDDYVE